jgi:HK97 family phage major capsid protein
MRNNSEIINQLDEKFTEFIDDSSKTIDSIKSRVDGIELNLNRQSLGGGGPVIDPKVSDEHLNAFNAFARKGKEGNLLDLEIKAALSTGSDPDGGYAVPVVIDNDIEKLLLDFSPMRRICNVIQTTTPNYHKLVNVGSMTSGWVGETAERPETTTPKLAKLTPYWGEIYANPAATQQSLDDMAFDVESFLTEGIVDEFSVQEGTSLISGDGLLKPKGLLTYPTATISDATRDFGTMQYVKTGAAAAFAPASATVSPADCLVNLVHSLRQGYRQGAVWLMNSNTLATVRKFKSATDGLPIWQQGLTEGQPSTLLGYPIEEDENMPDVAADAFPIAFGNFKRGMTIVDRVGTRVLRDPFSNKPYVHFYATRRVGSFLNNSQAIKLLKVAA